MISITLLKIIRLGSDSEPFGSVAGFHGLISDRFVGSKNKIPAVKLSAMRMCAATVERRGEKEAHGKSPPAPRSRPGLKCHAALSNGSLEIEKVSR